MEVLEPGYLDRLAREKARVDERREREAAWFDSLVALQQAGRIEEAASQAEADMNAGRLDFVYDPPEWLAALYAKEVDRLLAGGDGGGAVRAAREAMRQMEIWASWSTSGGEGTARMTAAGELQRSLDAKLARHNVRA
jgi:hypothetical protein